MKKLATLFLFLFAFALAGCGNSETSDTDSDAAAAGSSGADSSDSASTASDADANDTTIVIVNGVSIPAARIPAYTQGAPVGDSERQRIMENVAVSELVAQLAESEGYAAEAEQELIVARQAVLGRIYATKFLDQHPITDERVQELYGDLVENSGAQQEYDVSHILVEDEALANELQTQINADASVFGALASEHSVDTFSAQNEGKLGWFANDGQLVPEFSQAMAALAAGEHTQTPVQSQFGWHIIKVDGVRAKEPPALTPELANQLRQREGALLFSEHLDKLRQEAQIEFK